MLPRLRPGETPTAEDWNAIADLVEQMFRVSGTGNTEVAFGATGFQVYDLAPQPLWVRITDDRDGNKYGWVRVFPAPDGSAPDEASYPGRITGASDSVPAVAIGGATDVPEGAKVQIWPDPEGRAFYVFEDPTGSSTTPNGTYVHVTAVTGTSPRLYTVKTVQRNSGNTGWEEVSPAVTYTDVVEDQNRLLYVDGSGTVSQAYELHTDLSGRKWIELDQNANRVVVSGVNYDYTGFVNHSRQTWQGPKVVLANPDDSGSDLGSYHFPLAFVTAPTEGDQYRGFAVGFNTGGADDGSRAALRGGNKTSTSQHVFFSDADQATYSATTTAGSYALAATVDSDQADVRVTGGTVGYMTVDDTGTYVGVGDAQLRTGRQGGSAGNVGPFGNHLSFAGGGGGAGGTGGELSYETLFGAVGCTTNFVLGRVVLDKSLAATLSTGGTFGVVRDDGGTITVKLGIDDVIYYKTGSSGDPDSSKAVFWGGLLTGRSANPPIDPP